MCVSSSLMLKKAATYTEKRINLRTVIAYLIDQGLQGLTVSCLDSDSKFSVEDLEFKAFFVRLSRDDLCLSHFNHKWFALIFTIFNKLLQNL